jgi:hypothetical protein
MFNAETLQSLENFDEAQKFPTENMFYHTNLFEEILYQ